MKVVIITTDEPFYIPLTIQKLIESEAGKYIKRIILLPPTAKKRTWNKIIFEQLRFGVFYFVYRSIQFIIFKFLSKKGQKFRGRYYSVEAVAKAYGIPLTKIQNVNSEESINLLKQDSPDLIVSISASQIFSKKVINIPRWGTINVHNAPLPKYQGLMPSFWILYHNEQETATTVHFMDEKIDTGDIIVQKRVPIDKDETLDSLIKKTKLLTVDALIETFKLFLDYNGKPPTKPNPKEDATYFSFPSREDIKKFKKQGKKILWRNIY